MYRLLFAFVFFALVLAVAPAVACDPNVPVGAVYGAQQFGVPVGVNYYAQQPAAVFGFQQVHTHFNSGFHVAAQPPVVVAAPPVVKIKIINRRF